MRYDLDAMNFVPEDAEEFVEKKDPAVLVFAFTFSATPQGYDYWRGVRDGRGDVREAVSLVEDMLRQYESSR